MHRKREAALQKSFYLYSDSEFTGLFDAEGHLQWQHKTAFPWVKKDTKYNLKVTDML